MKQIILLLSVSLFSFFTLSAQELPEALKKNASYTGAVANKTLYKAIYQLDSNTPATIEKAFRNIRNLLHDPRLIGKVEIELITFSGGTEAYLKNGKYEADLIDLISKGVQVSQCLNSLKERNLTRDDLFPFVGYVPSGNGELLIRAAEGWVIIKP